MIPAIPSAIHIRLDQDTHAALLTILGAIQAPHRRAPTISEAVRAALMATAGTLAAAGQVAAATGA